MNEMNLDLTNLEYNITQLDGTENTIKCFNF